jgi:hypothetical protein
MPVELYAGAVIRPADPNLQRLDGVLTRLFCLAKTTLKFYFTYGQDICRSPRPKLFLF